MSGNPHSPQEKAPAFAGAFSCEIVYTKRRALWLLLSQEGHGFFPLSSLFFHSCHRFFPMGFLAFYGFRACAAVAFTIFHAVFYFQCFQDIFLKKGLMDLNSSIVRSWSTL